MQFPLFDPIENILPFDGTVLFYPNFFSAEIADQYLQYLLQEIEWKQEPIRIFGKQVMQPRLTAFYGDTNKPYSYSGITMQAHQWNDVLLDVKERIETVAGVHFTSALLNQYRHGSDSMGWHRDNEKELGINPVIGSVSFGATRKFQLRNYQDKKITRTINLTHGSLLLMLGSTQHCWEHQVPKTSRPTGTRVNITFRVL